MSSIKERPILFTDEMVRAILEDRKTQTRRVVKPSPGHQSEWATVASLSKCPTCYLCEVDGQLGAQFQHAQAGKHYRGSDVPSDSPYGWFKCPYGKVGERLWVRETWADVNSELGPSLLYRSNENLVGWEEFSKVFDKDYGVGPSMNYAAYPGSYDMWWSDLLAGEPDHKWRSPRYMPRWASRITLEITNIRVERVQDITEDDAVAEGVTQLKTSVRVYPSRSADKVEELLSYRQSFEGLWDSINKKKGFGWDVNPWVWVVEFKRIEGKGDE